MTRKFLKVYKETALYFIRNPFKGEPDQIDWIGVAIFAIANLIALTTVVSLASFILASKFISGTIVGGLITLFFVRRKQIKEEIFNRIDNIDL